MAKKKAAKAAPKKTTAKKAVKTAPTKVTKASAAKPARVTAAAGFSLSDTAISITVDDLKGSLAWYTDVLGFRVTERWEHQGVLRGAELTAGDVTMYLSQDDGQKGPRSKGQGVRIYWYTTRDIDALAAGIKSRGGTLASEPKDEWGTRSFGLQDPTGYLITVSSER